MKVLFIARSYPPIIGGMEKVSYELVNHTSKFIPTYLIVNTKGKKFLPIFAPIAFFKSLFLIKKNNITNVHFCDSLLSPIAYFIKKLTKTKVSANTHGLDITYKNYLYQKIIPFFLKRLDKIIAVSNYTKEECLKRGVKDSKLYVIPNGINHSEFILNKSKRELTKELEKIIGIGLKNKKILLSVGHLVKRKGFLWFIKNCMPELNEDYLYLIIGGFGNESSGNEFIEYNKIIKKLGLEKRVFLLGKVSKNVLKIAYNLSDKLIMPNIKVLGDAEGFGIVAIEAGSCGLEVIASNIEGIRDAVINGKTGWLVKENSVKEFIEKIKLKSIKRSNIRKIVKKRFDWKGISKQYLEILK